MSFEAFSTHPMNSKAGEVRWLYVDFDSYFASCEQQMQPELRGKPVGVLPIMSDSTCIIAASYEAKAFGIKTGTPVWEAKKMCPGIRLVPARHKLYAQLHLQIKETLENCHPVSAVCSIDEFAMHLRGPDRDPVKARQLGLEIMLSLHEKIGVAVRCSIGISSNMFLAKVASALDKPNGLSLLLPEELPGRLLNLAPKKFPGIGRNMVVRLQSAGIGSTNQLWAASAKEMKKIWGGIEGEKFWLKLHGYDLPAVETKKTTIGHSRVLAPEVRAVDAAYDVARVLLLKAVSRLRQSGYCAGTLVVSARSVDGVRWFGESHPNPSNDSFVFMPLLRTLWNDLSRQHAKRKLLKVGVSLNNLIEEKNVAADLFAPQVAKPTQKLSVALDAIHARFGRQALTLGWEAAGLPQLGTKIAFTRVPDMDEFDD